MPGRSAALLLAVLLAACSDSGQRAPSADQADAAAPEYTIEGDTDPIRPEATPPESLISALLQADDISAGELTRLLQDNEQTLSRLLPDFQRQSFNDAFERRLFDTLGRLGSDSAQQLLADVLTDPFVTDEQRFRSLMALRQVGTQLGEETLSRMMDYALDVGVTLENESFRNDTLLVLGEISAEDNAVAGLLTDALRSTADLDRIATLLTALGNARLPELETELGLYLSREDPVIRARAAYALGNLQTETATGILLDQLSREQDETVAIAILQRLDESRPSQAGVETIIRFALEHPGAEAKAAAVRAIDGTALSEASILMLEEMRRESTDEALIDAIGRLLRNDAITF